jgi:hypothetical protein
MTREEADALWEGLRSIPLIAYLALGAHHLYWASVLFATTHCTRTHHP